MPYTVALQDPQAPAVDSKVLTRLTAEALEVHALETMQMLRRHHGKVLVDHLEQEQADKLIAGLAREGITAISLPEENLRPITVLGVSTRLEYQDDSLRAIVGTPGKPVEVTWKDIIALTLALVQVEKTTQKVEQVKSIGVELTGGIGGIGIAAVQRTEQVVTRDTHIDRQLVAGVLSGDGRFLAIPGKGLTYAHLGDRLSQTSAENYQAVLGDLLARSPHAFRTHAYQAFADGKGWTGQAVPSVKALEDEAWWLLQLHDLGKLAG